MAATVDKTAEFSLTIVSELGIRILLAPRRTWLETVPGGVYFCASPFSQELLPTIRRYALSSIPGAAR